MKKKIQITEGPLLPNIMRFALPLMATNILQLLFNAVDVVVIGRFAGKASLAAVSSTGPLVGLTVNLFIGLSVGSNVIVARNIGSGNKEKVRKAVQTSIAVSFITGIILTILGVSFARFFLEIMDSPQDVINLSTIYLRTYFLGMPGVMLYNFGAAILRANGDTKRPLYFLMISGVLNVLMNLVFVLVFKMNTAGVGLATALSQTISALLVLIALINETELIRVDMKKLAIDKETLIDIAKIGLPAGLQGITFSISNIVIQSTINSFGADIMAGSGSAGSIEGFIYNTMSAFYQACMTFTSQNLGAKKYDRINKILLVCELCSFVVGFVAGNGAYIFGAQLLAIYNDDAAVIAAGLVRLGIVGRTYWLNGALDQIVGSLRGLGHSTIPMLNSLIGISVVRILWIKTVFARVGSINTVFFSYPISWTITTIIHFIYFVVVRKNLDKQIAKENEMMVG